LAAFSSYILALSKKSYEKRVPNMVMKSTAAHPIGNVNFPTFTICSFGMSEEILEAGIAKQFLDFLEEKKNISHGLNPYQIMKNFNVSLKSFITHFLYFVVLFH